MELTPKKMFFTRGVGFHRNSLQSFEIALRDARIEKYNLVKVSSIFPPDCKLVPRHVGIRAIKPGQICFLVLARESTNEPNRRVAAAIGLAQPKDKEQYGYISEHHAFGQTSQTAAGFAENLAATMLASTQGVELDPKVARDERKQAYQVGQRTFSTRSIARSASGHKDGLWTTVIAAAVMLLD